MTPSQIAHLVVSDHAARRFVERRGAPGVERAHPRKGQVLYIRSGGWLLVVEEYQGKGSLSLTVKTVFVPSPEECWWW